MQIQCALNPLVGADRPYIYIYIYIYIYLKNNYDQCSTLFTRQWDQSFSAQWHYLWLERCIQNVDERMYKERERTNQNGAETLRNLHN